MDMEVDEDYEDGEESSYDKEDRENVLGFKPQKELFFNFLLPYHHELDHESNASLNWIKQEFGRTLAMREIHPGLGIIVSRLMTYMKLYGMKFSKDDHINFINILLKVISIKNLPPSKLNKCCLCLTTLLRKSTLLSPEDLLIEWRPLYNLSKLYIDKRCSKGENIRYFSTVESNLLLLIQLCNPYFHPNCGKEILDELLPTMEPLENGKLDSVMDLLSMFLNPISSYHLWFDKLMNLWEQAQNPSWGYHIMNLVSSTAAETIGLIDWNQNDLIPKMFTRILRSLELPVLYKQIKSARNQTMFSDASACFIVSVLGPKTPDGMKYLQQLMSQVESYVHVANRGKYTRTVSDLILQLAKYFQDRLVEERYKPHPWKRIIPDEYKLRDEDITEFVLCLRPAAMLLMYSKVTDATELLKQLADLKPDLILPNLFERFFAAVDTILEPHKYTSVLQCLAHISHSAVLPQSLVKTQVIPLLFAVLPGIDSNDHKKTALTLQYIMLQSISITFVDCSKASLYHDLTEDEQLICNQTSELEDWVLQFLDKIFTLISSTSAESTRMENASSHLENLKSKLDSLHETLIRSTLIGILSQCSEEILTSAMRKLVNYIESHILEPKVSAPLLAVVCRAFVSLCPNVYKSLMPYLLSSINDHFSHEDVYELEKQNDELLYYLTLLSSIVRDDPTAIQSYIDELIPITEKLLRCTCKSTHRGGVKILTNLLLGMSTISTKTAKTAPDAFTKPLEEYLPIRDWGAKFRCEDKIEWFTPGENERKNCEKLIHHFLLPILEKFQKFCNDELELTKDDLDKYLRIVHGILCGSLLPDWEDEEKEKIETFLDLNAPKILTGYEHLQVKMPDGRNIREKIYESIHNLQIKVLEKKEDDFNALCMILNVYERLHCNMHVNMSFDNQLKIHQKTKTFQEFRLCSKRRDVPNLVATRSLLQQDLRIERSTPKFTKTHHQLMLDLVTLSTSHYATVRSAAQSKLFKMFSTYAFAYRTIANKISELLLTDPNENHEQFKGALYLIVTNRKNRLINRPDWDIIEKFWLTLLKTQLSEKLSILRLLDSTVNGLNSEFQTIATEVEVDDQLAELGAKMMVNQGDLPKDYLNIGLNNMRKVNNENREKYLSIVKSIIQYCKQNNLHFRYKLMALTMVNVLVHPVTNYPSEVTEFCCQNLINENSQERNLSLHIMNSIMKQQKRKNLKIVIDPYKITKSEILENHKIIPGFREDNSFLQYDLEKVPKSQQDWDQPIYMFKTNGFFGWTPEYSVYAPSAQQPNLNRTRDELNDHEKIIFDFLSSNENVDKLIQFWSLEEKKGKEKFTTSRFRMIRSIFKIFGLHFLDTFLPHLKAKILEEKSAESSNRCAAEILAGILRGAKHWDYKMTSELYEKIGPSIRTSLDSITNETDGLWGTAYATSAEKMDPMKQYWLHEILLENPIREQQSSVDCSRLYCLQGALNQHSWRMNSVCHRLLKYLNPFLNHPFQNIRQRVASTLINIFESDLYYPKSTLSNSPKITELIVSRNDELQLLYNSFDINEVKNPDSQLAAAARFFKTIAQTVTSIISRCTNGNEEIFISHLLSICVRFEKSFENQETEDDLCEVSSGCLALMAQALVNPKCMEIALTKIEEISSSEMWSSRLTSLNFLQVLVFNNMPTVLSREKWTKIVKSIVFRLLDDKVLEVREKSSEVLGGLIHCSFIPQEEIEGIVKKLKKKCKTKIPKKTDNEAYDLKAANNIIIQRHSAVLGFCAMILCQPYEVPFYVPPLFEILSNHLDDPHPIPQSIRKTIANFKRTHFDGWEYHKSKFTESQLSILSELTVTPSYYS